MQTNINAKVYAQNLNIIGKRGYRSQDDDLGWIKTASFDKSKMIFFFFFFFSAFSDLSDDDQRAVNSGLWWSKA